MGGGERVNVMIGGERVKYWLVQRLCNRMWIERGLSNGWWREG